MPVSYTNLILNNTIKHQIDARSLGRGPHGLLLTGAA
jgi:hypothetical protein